jgi:hypothetical protein
LIKTFEKLISLLITETQIEITYSKVHVYKYLGDILKNSFLQSVCNLVLSNENQFFEFQSTIFLSIPNEIQN